MRTISTIAAAVALSALSAAAQSQYVTALPPTPKVPGMATAASAGGYLVGSDDCAVPHRLLPPGPSTGNPFTTGTTGATGQIEALCYAFGTTGITNDVWFGWSATATGNATMTLCGGTTIDSKIAAWPNNEPAGCPADGTSLACNDDSCGLQSSITWAVTSGTTYTLQLGTFPGGGGGSGTFEIIQAVPPPCGAKDDGSTENALGLGAGGELGWIKVVTCALATHNSVATAYGTLMFPGSVTNGNASQVVVYTSLTAATNPADASWIMQTKLATVVMNGDTDILNKVTYPARNTLPGATTMVLASAVQVGGEFPAPIDQSAGNPDAWVVGSTAGSGLPLNTTSLTSNDVPPLNLTSQIGIQGTWLLRIENTPGGIIAVCFGDGSAAPCGCGNEATPGSGGGCANAAPMPAGQGAVLSASGTNSTVADDLVLTADFTTNQPGLFFQGNNSIGGGTGQTFGDGLRCCGDNVVRLEVSDPPGPNGVYTTSTTQAILGTSPPATTLPGDTRCYQWWYRNPGRSLCGATNNFNLSNSILVTWNP